MRVWSSSDEISLGEMNRERMACESCVNEYSFHSSSQSFGSSGMDSGMYKPPLGASPVKTA